MRVEFWPAMRRVVIPMRVNVRLRRTIGCHPLQSRFIPVSPVTGQTDPWCSPELMTAPGVELAAALPDIGISPQGPDNGGWEIRKYNMGFPGVSSIPV